MSLTQSTHVLQVLTGDDFYSEHDILYQGIEAKDELDADVLEHWPQAREFIEAARTANRKVRICGSTCVPFRLCAFTRSERLVLYRR